MRTISWCILSVGLALVGSACSSENAHDRQPQAVESASAMHVSSAFKTVRTPNRSIQVKVSVAYGDAVSPERAAQLLESIQVMGDPNEQAEGNGLYAYAQETADQDSKLNPTLPAIAVSLASDDPSVDTSQLVWSWPIRSFRPSEEPGIVLVTDGEETFQGASVLVDESLDESSDVGVATQASRVETKWYWFGARFDVYLNWGEACSIAGAGAGMTAALQAIIPQPWAALVGVGISAQVGAILLNMGSDGVKLKVFGPTAPTPGIIYSVERQGTPQSCKP